MRPSAAWGFSLNCKTRPSQLPESSFPKSARWPHGSQGESFAVLAMKGKRCGYINIANAIAVGEKKLRIVADELFNFLDAPGGQRFLTGVGEGHSPVFFVVVGVEFHVRFATQSAS